MNHDEKVDEFIDSLMHAKVYDPVAAKAYYERTKVLKGRRKAAGKPPLKMTRQAQASNTAVRLSSGLSTKKQAQIADLANKAKNELSKLTEALGAWADKARKDHSKAKEKAAADAEAKIKALPALPKNAGPGLKAQREKNIEKIRGEAAEVSSKLDSDLNSQIEQKRTEVKSQKDSIVDGLRAAAKKVSGNAN